MTAAIPSQEFEMVCEDSEFVLSRLKYPAGGPLRWPTAMGLDAATMAQALRTISAEMLTDKLVETLMVTAVQHAGVERGVLIVRRAEEPRVEAEATIQRGAIVARRMDTLLGPSGLPETIVKYVLRMQEPVMLDDASIPNPFSADSYLAEHRIRSLLCLPLVKGQILIGALYFEDRRSHIFTPPGIALVTMLASQAAISLENARLYEQIRSENILLREEIRKSVAGSHDRISANEE